MKKTIKVVAAIIQNKNGDVFIAERGYGFLKGKWEFPGGKVEKGEDDYEALKREIREELDTTLSIGPLFTNVKYDYGDFFLDRNCYLCHILEGRLKRKEGRNPSSGSLSADQSIKGRGLLPCRRPCGSKTEEKEIGGGCLLFLFLFFPIVRQGN